MGELYRPQRTCLRRAANPFAITVRCTSKSLDVFEDKSQIALRIVFIEFCTSQSGCAAAARSPPTSEPANR